MANRFDSPRAVCPACNTEFDLPTKRHRIAAEIACPNCRAKLSVQLGIAGTQRAKWEKK